MECGRIWDRKTRGEAEDRALNIWLLKSNSKNVILKMHCSPAGVETVLHRVPCHDSNLSSDHTSPSRRPTYLHTPGPCPGKRTYLIRS